MIKITANCRVVTPVEDLSVEEEAFLVQDPET
jgi:hypothetical protein